MTFTPGQSGNPRGKIKGTRHRTTIAAQALLEGEAEALSRKAVELALAGDTVALRLCLDRVVPTRRARVSFKLPEIRTAADLPGAIAAILEQLAAGELAADEAAAIVAVVEVGRKVIELTVIEKRLAALESAAGR